MAGDPLELSAFEVTGFAMLESDMMKSASSLYHIVRRYPFSSSLRRMSALLNINRSGSSASLLRLVCKGAPEVLEGLLHTVPKGYTANHSYYSERGYRVLALAYKDLPVGTSAESLKGESREEVERDLHFAGFLVLSSPLKADSLKTVRALTKSSHKVMMITGDAPLTASAVARLVKLANNSIDDTFLLDEKSLEWVSVVATLGKRLPFTEGIFKAGQGSVDLIVTGAAVEAVMKTKTLKLVALAEVTTVWARVSPNQKAAILLTLKDMGHITLMCGDGTNDVGALKNAHIGVSILNSPELERHDSIKKERDEVLMNKSGKFDHEKLRALESEMHEMSGMVVKFGDASVASPFTCRSPSIALTINILRQGRCTLVTTIQMFKILGVNSLMNAYSLSVLYLNGIKAGDTQSTFAGLFISAFFFFISRSLPLKKLSAERPQSKIFSPYVLLSTFGQFFIHLALLISAFNLSRPYIVDSSAGVVPAGSANSTLTGDAAPSESTTEIVNATIAAVVNGTAIDGTVDDSDGSRKFEPNVINTVVYLIGLTIQANAFGVNYRGYPFMQSLRENVLLFRGLLFLWFIIIVAISDLFPPLNDLFELVELPNDEFRLTLLGYILLDTFAAYGWEAMLQKLFPGDESSSPTVVRSKKVKDD